MKRPKGLEADFSAVRALVDDSPRLVDLVDRVFSAALILSPVVLGPAAVPLLALFDMKSDMIRQAGDLARRIAGRKRDFLDRGNALAAAHYFITWTAFFAAMDAELDLGSAELTEEQRADVIQRGRALGSEVIAGGEPLLNYAGLPPVSLPHPAASFTDEADERRKTYVGMADTLTGLLIEMGVEASPEALRRLPDTAVRYYFAQYLDLMLDFEDFFRWAMLYEAGKTQEMVSAEAALAREAVQGLDLGLRNLGAAVERLAAPAGPGTAQRAAAALAVVYRDAVDERVITDSYTQRDDGPPVLTYPSKIEAFVPQAYKVVRYAGNEVNLEHEGLWAPLPRRDDLGPYLVSHFTSPYSTTAPLLVLGHPGSGKSLLTELIAARLAAPVFNTVRIELRDIDPELDIQAQIERQIRADTGHSVDWVEFSAALAGNPPLIILDGYDELLQSTGKVFAGYLDKVQRFQTRELRLQRPVRILVTSRVTLIDKAAIPDGTTVLRLMDFDEPRRARWIDLWNRTNAGYFDRTGVEPFAVPDRSQLVELAQQPLLLLMLAIFDAESNELGRAELDQTILYDSLLRRFIRRERAKGDFESLPAERREAIIDADLARLGVAAIGMFNRRSLHILQSDLDQDIDYFTVRREIEVTGGEALTQADLLLGSFFFIHESRSRVAGGAKAFEFLHNTFGEFLAADFIVRRLLWQGALVSRLRGDDVLLPTLRETLSKPHDHWFASLSFTALQTRPVVLRMIREWLPHRAGADTVSSLQLMITQQLRDVLGETPPAWFLGGTMPFARFSYLGHLAVYSLNLVLVGAMISGDGFQLELPAGTEAETPWMRLVSLWRSWFTPEVLAGVTAMIYCEVAGSRVTVHATNDFGFLYFSSRIDLVASLSRALGDDLTHVPAMLAQDDKHGFPGGLEVVREAVTRANLDLHDVIDARMAKHGRFVPLDQQPWLVRSLRLRHGTSRLSPLWTSAAEIIQAAGGCESAADGVGYLRLIDLSQLERFSRYEAWLTVRAVSSFDPEWGRDIVLDLVRQDTDGVLAMRPGPRHFLAPLLAELRRRSIPVPAGPLLDHPVIALSLAVMDVTTLIELRLLATEDAAATRLDGRLIEAVASWPDLRDVPEDTLVAFIHMAGEQQADAPLRRRLGEIAVDAWAIGVHQSFGAILAAVALAPKDVALDASTAALLSSRTRSRVLALLRSARARDDARVLRPLFGEEPGALARRLNSLGLPDSRTARRELTAQQLDDFQWLSERLGDSLPW